MVVRGIAAASSTLNLLGFKPTSLSSIKVNSAYDPGFVTSPAK
ncbi:hypothetical protein NT05LI_3123 [Listeria ivanovii FSL F6-596]|nr:hypothetical protein NT05LI_3123 [Listeria ivanovii FSL F6-596]